MFMQKDSNEKLEPAMINKNRKYIVHVDMDAFFASIEQRYAPSCKGKPVIVGADPKNGKGRGVVSACSYEARGSGIHSAMPISTAYRKCPDAIFLPVNMSRYVEISYKIFEILERFTPDIEPISIDEAFLDITRSYHLFGSPIDTCKKIKNTIKKETGLTASIGLAPNKMTAKIASDLHKPDGLTIVTQQSLLDFLHPLPVNKLWGVGEKTLKTFQEISINTIGDLAKYDVNELISILGKNGEHVWTLANGIDPRDVELNCEIKSISNEYTFEQDTSDKSLIKDTLMYLSEKVSRRLRKADLKGKTITLKIRFEDFKTFTRSTAIDVCTNFVDDIYKNCIVNFEKFNSETKAVRLLGVGVSNLADDTWQDNLFSENFPRKKKEKLHKALDAIINKFGEGIIKHRKI